MDNEFQETDSPQEGRHGEKEFGHVPVLLQPAIEFLAVRRGGTYIDATLGLGGHSWEIAKRLGAQGRLIGFDKDPAALAIARQRLAITERDWPSITLLQGSFSEAGQRVEPGSADG